MSSLKCLTIAGLIATSLTAITYADGQTASSSSNVPAAPQSRSAIRQQNQQLERNVRHALSKTKNLDATDITVLARSGAITLNGSALDDNQIQLAATTAASVNGVTSVKNDLHIRETGH